MKYIERKRDLEFWHVEGSALRGVVERTKGGGKGGRRRGASRRMERRRKRKRLFTLLLNKLYKIEIKIIEKTNVNLALIPLRRSLFLWVMKL